MESIELNTKKILVTGGEGFLGRAVVRYLKSKGVPRKNISIPRSRESDLRSQLVASQLVADQNIIIHLAAKVGGIAYNKNKPAELFYDNLIMGLNLMEAARKSGVEKFVTVGTVCSYPKHTPVPFREESLWQGFPEETNAPYGIAKLALLIQSQAYRQQYGLNAIYLIPVNLYGPEDNFHPESSHVIPALIRKIYLAKQNSGPLTVWGTGQATREFLYVDDAAEGIVLATQLYNSSNPINLGTGEEISILDLVKLIAELMDYQGTVKWDPSQPDGQPRRKLDITRAKQEFHFLAKTNFREGLKNTIDWYLKSL